MKRIVEAVAKEVNFGNEVMVQLELMENGKSEYVIVHDLGEMKAFGVSDINVLQHYIEDQADEYDPQFKVLYESEAEALKSKEYAPFFHYANCICVGFMTTTND